MHLAAAPGGRLGRRPLVLLVASSLALAAASLLAPSTPSYDAWAWLIWGREIASGTLDTTSGPAWKPLPVLVTAVLAPVAAAPDVWLVLARGAAVAAVALVALLAWRLSGRSLVAAAVAGGGLVLTVGFVRGAALGFSEALLVALVAAAAHAHLDGRRRLALALALAAALLRPETWPFLVVYGALLWRRREGRGLVAAAAVAVPALWFLPELWGSGELLRSTERARIPNPGQPALAAVPALEVAQRFAVMVVPVVTVGLVLALRRSAARAVAVAALAWVALVAAMAQAGFAGEERYLLPAAAAACVAAGVAWATPGRVGAGALVLLACVSLAAATPAALELRRDLADDARLREGLRAAVERAGGADRLRCGALAAGRYRFPLVAWHLEVPISAVAFTLGGREGTVLRSRLRRGEPAVPEPPAGGRLTAAAPPWQVWSTCAP